LTAAYSYPRLSINKSGLQQGELALPLSPSRILQQSALENIAEFFALVLERRDSFLVKRIDIASDELTLAKEKSFTFSYYYNDLS
jgi:hypothetical protein